MTTLEASLMWRTATEDIEAEREQLSILSAKERCADLWPFVSLAQSDAEFGHRIAMVQSELEDRLPEEFLRQAVIEGFAENFQILAVTSSGDGDDNGDTDTEAEAPTGGDDSGVDPNPTDDSDPNQVTSSRKTAYIWHVGQQRWAAVESTPQGSGQNPWYGQGGQEAGPATGNTGTYPVEVGGPDPWNPINGNVPLPPNMDHEPTNRFPAEPQAWNVNPANAWQTNPMNFAPYKSAAVTPIGQGSRYTDEGVETGHGQNPNYFGEGSTGLASPEGNGFPTDVSLPEPDERLDFYQNMNPNVDSGMGGSPKEAAKDNHGACASCNQPVYRQGKQWKHLNPANEDHTLLLPADHPWVQQKKSALALKKQANQYIKPSGDGFVITQKGTGKVLSHHDTKDKAEAAFRAMMQSKHGSARFLTKQADDSSTMSGTSGANPFVPQTAASPSGAGGGASAGGTAPQPPPSMAQGGPGAEAMPPMQTPGGAPNTPQIAAPPAAGAGTSSPSPAQSGAVMKAGSLVPSVHAFFRQADESRMRPTTENPLGVPDEYDSNTWEGPINQRPRQDASSRGVNTPQQAKSPIPQISSGGGQPGGDEEDEDED